MTTMRVLLVDDHRLVTDMLSDALGEAEDVDGDRPARAGRAAGPDRAADRPRAGDPAPDRRGGGQQDDRRSTGCLAPHGPDARAEPARQARRALEARGAHDRGPARAGRAEVGPASAQWIVRPVSASKSIACSRSNP